MASKWLRDGSCRQCEHAGLRDGSHPGWDWDGVRFHHATQYEIKTHEVFISRIFHLIFKKCFLILT